MARNATYCALEQRQRALGVAALNMCDADRQLRQPLPQHAFLVRATLPRPFEYLVCVEREALIEEVLRPRQRVSRKQIEVVGNPLDADAPEREWTAESVAGP